MNISVVMDQEISYEKGEMRFVIKDMDTGEVIDNAQGHGFKTMEKAYAAYNARPYYQEMYEGKKKPKTEQVIQWLQDHPEIEKALDENENGMWIDAKDVGKILAMQHCASEFTAHEILGAWRIERSVNT